MATKTTGRTEKGTFAPGHTGGPGRPPRATEISYLRMFAEACPPERFKEIVEAAVESAKAGDAKAREWVSGYLCGNPSDKALLLSKLSAEELKQEFSARRAAVERASEEHSLSMQEMIYGSSI